MYLVQASLHWHEAFGSKPIFHMTIVYYSNIQIIQNRKVGHIAYFRIRMNHLPSPHRPSHESSASLPRFEVLSENDEMLKRYDITENNHSKPCHH